MTADQARGSLRPSLEGRSVRGWSRRSAKALAIAALVVLATLVPAAPGATAQTPPATAAQAQEGGGAPSFPAALDPSSAATGSAPDEQRPVKAKKAKRALNEEEPVATDWEAQQESLRHALIRLPIAAALSAILAFRPRRRGTPARQAAVIQTQIILAIVGAIVMLVVGASLARAFGIVGAAGLIRYRAKIEDPKDAGVMLSTLAIGLASGVGLYLLVVFSTFFVLVVLWIIESIEPLPSELFHLTITVKDSAAIRPTIERTLRRFNLHFNLRSTSADDVSYEVRVPLASDTDRISTAIAGLDSNRSIDVKWEKQKDK